MNVQTVPNATALSPGKETWVLPSLNQSRWTQKVDWYLNFILTRAQQHEVKGFDSKLSHIVNDNELPLGPITVPDDAAFLLGSESRLPNKQTVVIPYADDIEKWIHKAHEVWSGLNQPSVRIFLPTELSADDFKNHWPKNTDETTIEIVNHLS